MKKLLTVLFAIIPWCVFSQNQSKYIVVDQFGYLPEAKKIAIVRSPQIGFDANESFTPSKRYAVVDAKTNKVVFKGTPVIWRDGAVDSTCGDKVWRFDFSEVQQPGSYYVKDLKTKEKSFEFAIADTVYKAALRSAFRYFYYQRAGYEKLAKYAGEGWADKASHVGPHQDKNCRDFLHKDDSTNRAFVTKDLVNKKNGFFVDYDELKVFVKMFK